MIVRIHLKDYFFVIRSKFKMNPQQEVAFEVENRDYPLQVIHHCCEFRVEGKDCLFLKPDFEEELCTSFCFLPHLRSTLIFIN